MRRKSVRESSRETMREKVAFRAVQGISQGRQEGFSLLELLIALAIFVVVAGIVTSGLVQMTNTQGTINNRTEMHSSVRNTTELLQQEIGQAGRVTLPPGNATPQMLTPVAVVPGNPVTQMVVVTSTAGMFDGEQLVIDAGSTGLPPNEVPNQETVTIQPGSILPTSFTATFTTSHAAPVPIAVLGGFNSGIVPKGDPLYPTGSTGFKLILYGDINGDGNMVIVQYDCNPSADGKGTLTRSETPWNAAAPGPTLTLLDNLYALPGNPPCFTYQPNPLTPMKINGVDTNFITDVAVTLTVQTEFKDPVTHQFQTETKALLNVSPRNIFDVWERASQGVYQRIQPMPPSVKLLLPQIY